MDRGAWQATIHGVSRVGPDLATKPPQLELGHEEGMMPGKGENKILNTQLLMSHQIFLSFLEYLEQFSIYCLAADSFFQRNLLQKPSM